MKLLTRTGRYYLLWSSVAFLLAGIGFYFILRSLIHESVNETLLAEQHKVIQELQRNPTRYSYFQNLEVEAVETFLPFSPAVWSDTSVYNEAEREAIPYRQLTQVVSVQGKPYRVVLRESLIESDDLIGAVFTSLLLLLVVLVGGLFYINRLVTQKVWQPFWDTLTELATYQPRSAQALALPPTPIDEFSALNQVVTTLTGKVQRDYRSLKEFTENASHETQTPLAIIRGQLEWLLQADSWSEAQLQPLQTIQEQVNRLTRLHASLLLLAKIENGQFPPQAPVPLAGLLTRRLAELKGIIEFKEITVETSLASSACLPVHPLLADSLVGNLLGNAIKHNVPGGKLRVEATTEQLLIANTGEPFLGNPEQFFERFSKQRPTSDSTGLGLSIAQKICQLHGLMLTYTVEGSWHTLSVRF